MGRKEGTAVSAVLEVSADSEDRGALEVWAREDNSSSDEEALAYSPVQVS